MMSAQSPLKLKGRRMNSLQRPGGGPVILVTRDSTGSRLENMDLEQRIA